MKQNRPYVIALTGGIATGKSTVAKIIKENGYKVLDSDKIVHKLYIRGNKIYNEVLDYFGKGILDENGDINRKKLGEIVFSDKVKLIKLNEIVHKEVVAVLIDGISNCQDDIIFLDIPLLIEQKKELQLKGLYYDEIWIVYVSKKTQLKRLLVRDNRGEEQSKSIINSQMDINIKAKHADVVINNESDFEELKKKVTTLISEKIIENCQNN